MEALHSKKAFADRTDARLRIVTQFGFDAEKVIAWAENLLRLGLDVPVHIGVAGPAKISSLIKYGTLCWVGNSLSMLTRHAGKPVASGPLFGQRTVPFTEVEAWFP